LDDALAHLVLAFPELVVPDPALRIGEVRGRPVPVGESGPDRVGGVECDRVLDPQRRRGLANVVGIPLEWELRRVDADDDQPVVAVLLAPCAKVAERAEPVDARVRPEVDEHDLPAQVIHPERG
jgi:hypothetical protein